MAAVDENGNGQPLIMTSDAYQTRSASRTRSEIVALPPDVVAQIKSSSSITSLNDVIFGLVQNSLDAAADKVAVDVVEFVFVKSEMLEQARVSGSFTVSRQLSGFVSHVARSCLFSPPLRAVHVHKTNFKTEKG